MAKVTSVQNRMKFLQSLQPLRSFKTSNSPSAVARTSEAVQWVVANQLAIGQLPTMALYEPLMQANVRVILSLCAPAEGILPDIVQYRFECVRYILPDSSYIYPLTVEQLTTAVELVHQNIQAEKPVYVHCLAGIERSPTVCAAYLCRYHQLELWEALNQVRQARPYALPTDSQLQVIRAFLEKSEKDALMAQENSDFFIQ